MERARAGTHTSNGSLGPELGEGVRYLGTERRDGSRRRWEETELLDASANNQV